MEDKTYNNSGNEDSRNLHKATTPRHEMVFAATFRRSAKGTELYTLEVSELFGTEKNEELAEGVIPMEYQDMQGAINEEASNELPDHGASDMKIEFKEGQEPQNTGLRPMSSVELQIFGGEP